MHTYTFYVGQSAPQQIERVLSDVTIGSMEQCRGYWEGTAEDTTRVWIALPSDRVATVVAARLAYAFCQDSVLVRRSYVPGDMTRTMGRWGTMARYREAVDGDVAFTELASGFRYAYVREYANPTDTVALIDALGTDQRL